MYINFEQMMTSGLTMSDVGYLLMIRQKEEMASVIPKEKIDSYKASGYIELQKNGKWKITPRGGSLLMLIETPGLTPEVEGIRQGPRFAGRDLRCLRSRRRPLNKPFK